MGLFDGVLSFLSWINSFFTGGMPQGIVLIGWGMVGSGFSMAIYVLLSSQTKLARIKEDIADARKAVIDYEDDFAQIWNPVKQLLGLSCKQVGYTLLPTMAGAVPIVFLIVWVGGEFNYKDLQAGVATRLKVYPGQEKVTVSGSETSFLLTGTGVVCWPKQKERLELIDAGNNRIAVLPLKKTSPAVEKFHWWNRLFGTPNGYIPDHSPVDKIEIELPRKRYIPFGPDWMGASEAVFILTVLVTSLIIKYTCKIQ